MSGGLSNDLDLLRAYRERDDQHAFTQLVTRHVDLVYGTAYRRLRDPQLAEDASQRVFTTLARKGKRQHLRHLSSWLYAVTQREVLGMIRTESRRSRRERQAFEFEMFAQLAGSENDASIEALSEVLSDALKRMSEDDQQALFLRFYEEQEFREIGATLKIEERTAQKRVYRAMDRLRKILKKRGITATAAVFSSQLFTAGATPAPAGLAGQLAESALISAASSASLAAMLESVRWSSLHLLGGTAIAVSAGVLVWNPLRENLATDFGTAPASLLQDRQSAQLAVDDIEGIYQLDNLSRENAIARLVDHLEQAHEDDYFSDLFTRWTRLDPRRNVEAIAELANRLPDGAREVQLGRLMIVPLQAWWSSDRKGSEAWQQGLSRKGRGERVAFGALVKVVGQEAPLTAYTLVASRAGTSDEHYSVLADAFSKSGVHGASELLRNLPVVDAAQVSSTKDRSVIFEESEYGPTHRLYEALLPAFFAENPQATADWVTSLHSETNEANGITAAFVSLWAGHAPNDAAVWALELAGSEREKALSALTETWLVQDEDQALRWLETESIEPHLFGIAADHLGSARSLQWAAQLGSTPASEHLVAHAFFTMGQTHSQESLATCLGEIGAPSTQTIAATALAQGLLVGQGRAAVIALRTSLKKNSPDLAQAMFLGELDVMSALNPSTAAKLILQEPSSETRDEAIHVLLQRTLTRHDPTANEAANAWVDALSTDAQRRHWKGKLLEANNHVAVRKLPPNLSGGFQNQNYGEFQERLDLLATFPFKID